MDKRLKKLIENTKLKKDIDTVQNTDTDLCPTLDTRCDCLAVVVLENKNGNKN